MARSRTRTDSWHIVPTAKMKNTLLFRVYDVMPWHMSVVFAVQVVIGNMGGFLSLAYITTNAICPADDVTLMPQFVAVQLISTGIGSILALLCGSRLPALILPSFVFASTIPSSLSTSHWACPTNHSGMSQDFITNGTNGTLQPEFYQEPWKVRVNALTGGLIVGSLVQAVLGASGLISFVIKVTGPLTLIPAVIMIGISVVQSLIPAFSEQWGIALLTCALIMFFSHILGRFTIPMPSCKFRQGCKVTRYPIFQLLPHLLACGIAWLISYILTVTGVFSAPPNTQGYLARTDAKHAILSDTPWFILPYPGRWGLPTFSADMIIVMTVSVVCNFLQSIASYYIIANACDVPPPRPYVINRSLTVEGLTNCVTGLLGSPIGLSGAPSETFFTTVTKNASRTPRFVASIILIIIGFIGKFSAALSLIPDPIIGGMSAFILAVIISVSMAGLQDIDTTSSRNLSVLGFTIFMALIIPQSIRKSGSLIHTGHDITDVILEALMSNAMVVAATIGFTLDNILPGTKQERGLVKFHHADKSASELKNPSDEDSHVYDLPCGRLQRYVERRACHVMPLCPPYDLDQCDCRCRKDSPSENTNTADDLEDCQLNVQNDNIHDSTNMNTCV